MDILAENFPGQVPKSVANSLQEHPEEIFRKFLSMHPEICSEPSLTTIDSQRLKSILTSLEQIKYLYVLGPPSRWGKGHRDTNFRLTLLARFESLAQSAKFVLLHPEICPSTHDVEAFKHLWRKGVTDFKQVFDRMEGLYQAQKDIEAEDAPSAASRLFDDGHDDASWYEKCKNQKVLLDMPAKLSTKSDEEMISFREQNLPRGSKTILEHWKFDTQEALYQLYGVSPSIRHLHFVFRAIVADVDLEG